MTVRAGPVRPMDLKPTQAEFSPQKVQDAREFKGIQRPLITSGDGHLVDGHHQWLKSMLDDPQKPVPAVQINAPVRDILNQIHEFPRSGMDGPPQLRPGERQGDLLSRQPEDLRLVGESALDYGAQQAAREQADRDATAARAAQDDAQGRLFAARPAEGSDDDTQSVASRVRDAVMGLSDKLAGSARYRQNADDIRARANAAETLPAIAGAHAHGAIELDIPDPLDRQAAGAAVEAGYDPAQARQ